MNNILSKSNHRRLTGLLVLFVVAVAGLAIGRYTLIGAVAVAAIILGALFFIFPEWLFYGCIATIIIGQLIRLPVFGEDSGVLLNDILLPPLILFWIWKKIGTKSFRIPKTSVWWPALGFVVVMFISIIANKSSYSSTELIGGAMYALRWVEYAFLFLMAVDYGRSGKKGRSLVKALIWVGVVLSVLGFVQLKLFPDFTFMVPQGWDPHIGRLLSTWFDPNFLAGYLVATSCLSLCLAIEYKSKGVWWWVATAIMSPAIILTYSRSGYLALVVGFGIVALFRARWLLWIGAIALIGTFIFVPRVQQRVLGIRSVDETAQLRIVSWSNAAEVIKDNPIIGVGYNFYRYAQVRYGFNKDATGHSASGSDSSLLTVAVTTGVIGLFFYIWLYLAQLREAVRAAMSSDRFWKSYGLGLFAALVALFVHSQFVNGLLYPHIMQFIWITVGIAAGASQKNNA